VLESTVELLGGLLLSAVFTDRFFYRRLDCCCHTSGQPWKRYCEYEEVTEVFRFRG
jgi:hypothetical protein